LALRDPMMNQIGARGQTCRRCALRAAADPN
jgi:hypothetical protein